MDKKCRKNSSICKRRFRGGDYNWACFKAQQATEKALKAFLYGLGKPKKGHLLIQLLDEIGKMEFEIKNIKEDCIRLDKYYIPTRYPNAWPSSFPEELYTKGEAEEAIERTKRVIKWIKRFMGILEERK